VKNVKTLWLNLSEFRTTICYATRQLEKFGTPVNHDRNEFGQEKKEGFSILSGRFHILYLGFWILRM
jgi:hypothetical protein